MKLIALALAASGCLLMAQVTGVSHARPTLGFVPGSTTGALQPVLGVPGASRLGDQVSLPGATRLYLAPKHRYVLAQRADGGLALVILRGASTTAPIPRPLTDALQSPELVAFSPIGHAAVLYSQASNRLQVWTGLPDAPRVAQSISTLSIAGDVHRAAISDDSQIVLTADESGTVYRMSQAGNVPLYHATQVAALAFLPGTHEAIVSDSASNSVVVLDSASGRTESLTGPSNRCEPDEVAATEDGRTVLVACPAQRLLWSVNRESGTTSVSRIPVSPLEMDRVAARDTFLFSPPDEHGSYWMVRVEGDGLNVSFVGAYVPGAGQ
jgi:DNA-binding beta-propeller fold protein YncE